MSGLEFCGFDGNSDVWGIGVRIGFYTQALAEWYANYFLASEARSLRSASSIFLFALSLCMVVLAAQSDSTHVIEVFALQQFVMAFMSVGQNQERYNTHYLQMTPGQGLFYDFLMIFIFSFGFWFWWFGADNFISTPCGTYIWFVVKVDLYGWYRVWMKVTHTLVVCQFGNYWDIIPRMFQQRRFTHARRAFVEYARATCDGAAGKVPHPESGVALLSKPRANSKTKSGDEEDLYSRLSFETVLEAEQYLDQLLEIHYETAENVKERNKETYLRYNSGRICRFRAVISDFFFVWATSVRQIAQWPRYRRTLAVDGAVRRHMAAMRISYPFTARVLRRMMAGHEPGPPAAGMPAEALDVASDVRRSTLGLYTSRRWYVRATWHLLLMIGLIVQVELTIHLNGVRGLSGVFSFGQLLALVLGVGGLAGVLRQKVHNRRHGVMEEDLVPEASDYEKSFRIYTDWKEKRQVSLANAAVLASKEGHQSSVSVQLPLPAQRNLDRRETR